MNWETHAAAGAGSWIAVSALTGPPQLIPLAGGITVSAVAALLPDLDSKPAKASRYVPVLSPLASWTVRGFTTHRKGLHTVWAAGVLTLALLALRLAVPVPWWLAGAAALGYCSHILMDGFTVAPVFPAWPLSQRPVWLIWPPWLRVQVGGLGELFIVRPVVVGLAALAAWRGWMS